MDEKEKKVLGILENLCAKREYCRFDMGKKALVRLDSDREAAARVVSSLVEDGFVDDLRYATAFAREKSSLYGWGSHKIRFALSAKKIPEGLIREALGEIDADKACDKLARLLETKWKSLSDDPQARLKLIRFALSRGYGYEEVKPLVDKVCGA